MSDIPVLALELTDEEAINIDERMDQEMSMYITVREKQSSSQEEQSSVAERACVPIHGTLRAYTPERQQRQQEQ